MRPPDLLSIPEAARRVDRSPGTIRAWIRAGALQAWRDPPDAPRAALCVSASALQSLVVLSGKAARPGRPAPPDPLAGLRQERLRVQAELVEALERQVQALEGRVRDLERAIAVERERAAQWEARAKAAGG